MKNKLLSESARLYHYSKPIIGLTGGIATGKSSVSKILKEKNIPLIDADQLVKTIYQKEQAHQFIKKIAPEAYVDNTIVFPKLREIFFNDEKKKQQIEQFIYQRLPEVFTDEVKKLGPHDYIIYDVPLLFERQLETKLDASAVVTCSELTQKARLKSRDNISDELITKMINSQVPLHLKVQNANYVIDNDGSLDSLKPKVEDFISWLRLTFKI